MENIPFKHYVLQIAFMTSLVGSKAEQNNEKGVNNNKSIEINHLVKSCLPKTDCVVRESMVMSMHMNKLNVIE